VAALAARAAKKILPARWRFFLAACYTLVRYVFVEQRERLTKTALPAIFNIKHSLRFGFFNEVVTE
jgi:hypothetical protein